MRKLLLLVLAAPLAGCAQRADLASSVGQPAQGPFTLRYKLADQHSHEYQLRIEGDTTTGISSPSASEPATSDTTTAPERTVQAKFQTQMTVRQDATATTDPLAGTTTSVPSTTPSDTTTPSASESTGSTSMNEDRAPGNERAGETTMPSDSATEGASGSTSSATTANLFNVRQQITNWTAQVNLPEGQIPNRFNGSFQNGQMDIQAQGAQIDLPQRYQQQILQTLNRPVIATVTSIGEILNVEWPVPEQTSSAAPEMKTESSADGLRAMTGSTETLNLWFAVIRLPDQAVNVGQTWDAKDQFPVRAGTTGPQFYMDREAKYTLTNVAQTPEGPVAEIAVNETLKLIRGELPLRETSGATTGADSTVSPDTTLPSTAATVKPDLLQTRMGKVYFNLDRGVIDRAEQQVSVTWDTTVSTTVSSSAATPSHVATQGQLQGTVHLERISTTGATAGTSAEVSPGTTSATPANTPASTVPTSPPSSTAPTANTPGGTTPNGSARTVVP